MKQTTKIKNGIEKIQSLGKCRSNRLKCLLLVLTSMVTTNLYSQTDDGKSMWPIIEKSQNVISKIENGNYEIVKVEFDILNEEKSTFRSLQKGWTYNILAFGDYRANDIDVEIYKLIGDDWIYISKDADVSASAMVSITPVSDGMYKIIVKGYKYNYGYSSCHYGLIIFHE